MKIIVVIPTFYASTQDDDNNIRYNLALETCRAIANANSNNDSDSGNTDFVLQGLIVDASPDETVRQSMFDAGKGHIKVVKQTYQGKKGAALREGIALAAAAAAAAAGGGGGGGGNPEKEAATLLSSSTTTTATVNQEQEENVSINNNNNNNIIVIAFQEPEKVDMIRYWKTLGKKMVQENADLGVPIRTDDSFRSTYPIEQYHSEQFANHYLNALAKRASTTTTSSTTSSSSSSSSVAEIDWTMGPIAFTTNMACHWIQYHGDLWDMQLVPLVRAQRWYSAKLTTIPVDYQHPVQMKEEESGIPEWSEKRLFQLEYLFQYVGKAFKETSDPSSLG